MNFLKSVLASLALVLVSSAAFAGPINLGLGQTKGLSNCGGTINTYRGNKQTYLNITSSTCNQVRLYDVVVYKNGSADYFQSSSDSYNANFSYKTNNLYIDGSKLRVSFYSAWTGGDLFYTTAFVSKNGGRPYDKVLLWFPSRN